MRHLLVGEIMTRPGITIAWGSSILEASALMEEQRVRRLPVIDDENILIGILSLGDIREALSAFSNTSPYAPDFDEQRLAVDEVMTNDVITLNERDTVFTAVQLMLENKIGGIPVVGGAREVVGIITDSDIFRLLLTTWQLEMDHRTTPPD